MSSTYAFTELLNVIVYSSYSVYIPWNIYLSYFSHTCTDAPVLVCCTISGHLTMNHVYLALPSCICIQTMIF